MSQSKESLKILNKTPSDFLGKKSWFHMSDVLTSFPVVNLMDHEDCLITYRYCFEPGLFYIGK